MRSPGLVGEKTLYVKLGRMLVVVIGNTRRTGGEEMI